jgi:hypothetical protein
MEKGPVPIEDIPADYIGCTVAGMVRASRVIQEGLEKAQPKVMEAPRSLLTDISAR